MCVVKLVGFFIGEKVAEVLFQKMVDLSMNIFAPVLICHITSVPIFLSRFIGKKGFFLTCNKRPLISKYMLKGDLQ